MAKLMCLLGFAALLWSTASGTAQAGFFTGSINAHFANPVLTGNVIGEGFHNNTNSAVVSYYTNGPVAAINWGTNAGAPGSSNLTFSPNQNIAVSSDQEFALGTVTLYNGTSTLESLIFGADLILDFIPSGGGLAVDTLTLHVSMGTTFNGADQYSAADYISIPGISDSFFAFEGLGASAIVNGKIIGDPYMSPESFTVLENFTLFTGDTNAPPGPYNPADYTTIDSPGFAGGFTGPAPAPTPEPTSVALLLTGVVSALGFRSARRLRKR